MICEATSTTSVGWHPDLDSSLDVLTCMNMRSMSTELSVLRRAARPFSRASAFLMVSRDSTAQRLGIEAMALHLLLWRVPVKCQLMSRGSVAAFSTSSV